MPVVAVAIVGAPFATITMNAQTLLRPVLYVQLLCLVYVESLSKACSLFWDTTLALLQPLHTFERVQQHRNSVEARTSCRVREAIHSAKVRFVERWKQVPARADQLSATLHVLSQKVSDTANTSETCSPPSAFRERETRNLQVFPNTRPNVEPEMMSHMGPDIALDIALDTAGPTTAAPEKKRWSWGAAYRQKTAH